MYLVQLFARRLANVVGVFVASGLIVSSALALAPDTGQEATTLSLFLKYTRQFLTFDFADSPALEVVTQSAKLTFYLVSAALVLTSLIGVSLGLASGLARRGSAITWVSRSVETVTAAPVLIVALIMVLAATSLFGIMPEFSVVREGAFQERIIAFLLPVLALTFGDGLLADIIRSSEIRARQVREREFIRALRAKGVPTGMHYLRNLLPTISALIANKITLLFSAAVVVEYVFNWKGLGYAVVFALQQSKDYELVLLVTMLMVAVVLATSLVVTLISDLSDPRVRAGKETA
jgi:ABC-type dipeptide/oligopeptide/nickel transport system permease component